jgi:hypothetical protein
MIQRRPSAEDRSNGRRTPAPPCPLALLPRVSENYFENFGGFAGQNPLLNRKRSSDRF